MIIDPDFLDHWKTRLFVETMGEEHASNYILRLWFHCQQRRTTVFDGMTPQILKTICKYSGDAQKLWDAITHPEFGFALGYPNGNPTGLSVPKWAEANSKMLSNWENGHKGGRPKQQAKNPVKTPPENPTLTQTEPNANPSVTGRKVGRKEEKEGKDKAPEAELEKVAAEMANEFQFKIPGRSRPLLDELRAQFHAKLVWLRAVGRDETERIWSQIRDPTRDTTEVTTINQMFKFWRRCGLEEDSYAKPAKRPTAPGGDSYGDADRYTKNNRVKVLRFSEYGGAGNGGEGEAKPTLPPSQSA